MPRTFYKLRKLLIQKVLHANDTPHTIAFGVAIAMVVAFLPLVGFQTVIAVGLAAVLRANKAVCIPIVWITNPFTIVPIYGACWKLGQWVTASPVTEAGVALAKLEQTHDAALFFSVEFWSEKLNTLVGLSGELWVGCLVVGIPFAIVSYVMARRGVTAYRERRRQKILKRSLHRSPFKRAQDTPLRESA